MGIKTSEISSLIKEQIKNFNNEIKYTNDVGTVVTIGDGVALIYGLEKAMLGELLLFSNNTYGMVMNLEEDAVGAVLLGSDEGVKEGDEVKRTKRVVEVPVGDALLGRVVNALGQPIDGLGEIKTEEKAPVEKVAPSIMARQSVNSPLETGIIAIDAMIPIGKGQRELIIGDRQTGKTSIAIDTIINQVGKNVKCVYVAIGQKNSSVAAISKRLKDHNALSYSVIVNANASELAPLQYIAPYAGMTIAEYWCAKGEDVLIIFDDLSKHAVAYRTLSLLLKRSPGREAYPGDIFYLHSRLLERASKLNPAHGGGTITALPIVETLAGDISAYIPTNVISITDGQIFLQTDLFNAGQRPAIDSGLSVSRVGSAAQFNVIKKVAKSLKINLANFRELQSFSQFGSDLDETTRKTIKHGNILMEILKQNQFALKTLDRQVIELFTAKYGFLDELAIDEVKGYLDDLYDYLNKFHKTVLTKINTTKNIFKGERDALKVIITSFNKERKY